MVLLNDVGLEKSLDKYYWNNHQKLRVNNNNLTF